MSTLTGEKLKTGPILSFKGRQSCRKRVKNRYTKESVPIHLFLFFFFFVIIVFVDLFQSFECGQLCPVVCKHFRE